MDLDAARALLTRPLVFGDPEQIAAVDFIARVETCFDLIKHCTHGSGECVGCSGRGECLHCGHECDACEGSGIVSECSCLDGFDGVVLAAAVRMEREKRRAQ